MTAQNGIRWSKIRIRWPNLYHCAQ